MKSSIRISRRAAVAVALGSVLALTATACGDDGTEGGNGAEGSGKGEITFWDNNGGWLPRSRHDQVRALYEV